VIGVRASEHTCQVKVQRQTAAGLDGDDGRFEVMIVAAGG
jgi:hypothetical protein